MKKDYKISTIIYICSAFVLVCLFVYTLLDFFVIERDYSDFEPEVLVTFGTPVATETPMPETPAPTESCSPDPSETPSPTPTPTPTPTPEPTVLYTDTEYHDGNIDIVLTTYREYSTDIYVADIKLSSAQYLKTAFAKGTYGRNITDVTSNMAEENNAILAINGDYYGVREGGYVVRNGLVYRRTQATSSDRNSYFDAAILFDGTLTTFKEKETDFDTVASWYPWQVFCFGPTLVENGEVVVQSGYEVKQHLVSNPRTCIAQIGELHYIIMVSDGRTSKSSGMSLVQTATFLKSLGAVTAYNLDGGGSSTMVFNGKIINVPINSGKVAERSVSDIVYISP